MADTKMFICKEPFWANVDGTPALINTSTLVSEDSDVYRRFPQFFRVAEATFRSDTEQATAAPGERRSVKV